MAKQLLRERFQELAGIKEVKTFTPDETQASIDKGEDIAILSDDEHEAVQLIKGLIDKKAPELNDKWSEIFKAIFKDHKSVKELAGIKSLSEEEASVPFALDSRTIENLKYLTSFSGDEKIEELRVIANYILDDPSPSFEKK
jgi:hypothetical protein